MRKRILVGIVLCAFIAGTASALNYFPLGTGSVSYLQGVSDPAATLTLTVEENNGGVAALSVIESGGNDFAVWFQLTQDLDGQTYLLSQSFDGGASWTYTGEPVVWIDTPLEVGKTWSQETTLGEDTYVIDSEVTAHEVISVPAGEFTTYCITHVGVVGGVYTYTYIEWYAENVGIVKMDWTGFTHGDVYQLTDAVVIGTEAHSWGQVKRLYQQDSD